MSLIFSSDTTIWIVSILIVLNMSLILIYLFRVINKDKNSPLFVLKNAPQKCLYYYDAQCFWTLLFSGSYKDTVNLFLHLMFLLHLILLLLLTVRKLKLLMTVKVLVAHLLEHLLDPRIRKLESTACLQRNVIKLVLYWMRNIFFQVY